MTTLFIATRNEHKTEEIRSVLGRKFRYFTLKDFPAAPSVDETGKTFQENAAIKATEFASWLARDSNLLSSKTAGTEKIFVLADDSGLEVDALNGAPGVHSARFAAVETGAVGNSTDSANNAKLLRLLEKVPLEKRAARFRCVLALTQIPLGPVTQRPLVFTADGLMRYTKHFDGACEGKIMLEPSGKGGFGYDPLFIPDGYKQSFAELGDRVKNKISHRGRALEKLREHLSS